MAEDYTPATNPPPPLAVIDAQCSVCKSEGKGTYRTTFRCSNCGLEGEMVHSLGHERQPGWRDETCPRCRCETAHAGDYLEGRS